MGTRQKLLVLSIGFVSLFTAYAPAASAAITTCPGRPPVDLTWSSTNPASCTGGFTGSYTHPSCQFNASQSGTVPVTPSASCTVTLNCLDSGRNVLATASDNLIYNPNLVWNGSACTTTSPPPAPTANISVSPASIPSGSNTTYGWSSSNASYCSFYIDGTFRGDTNSGWPFNNAGWADGPLTANRTYTINCRNSAGQTVTSSATVTITSGAPTCSSSGPQSPSTTATSGTFYAYAYGVSPNTNAVNFATWGDTGGQDDLIWTAGTNLGGGTWRTAIDLGAHKVGNPEMGNINVHVYMNAPSYVNTWCGTANFTRSPPPPPNDAVCTNLTAPATATVGAGFNASVTMNNTGSNTWTTAASYRLGSQPQDNMTWGLNRVALPGSVASGNSTTFSFTGTAPASPGTYPFGWRMVQDGVQWFGTTCTQNIAVSCPAGTNWNGTRCVGNPSATISASPNPCTVALGGNTCSTNVTWNILNAQNPNLYSSYTGTQLSSAASGTNLPATVAITGTTFSARNSSSALASTVVTGVCASNLAYSGGVCVACSNGGCVGTPGGSPGSPNGGLSCVNGMTPPSCTPPPPTVTLLADPTTIDNGQTSLLTWTSTNATSCNAPGSFSGGSTPGGAISGSYQTPALTTTQNYQMSCTGAGGTANSNIATVTVLQPQVSLSATPPRVYFQEMTTISWSASQVKSCSISGPGLSSTALSGTRPVQITAQSTYTITCQTNGSPITKAVIVNLIPSFQEF